jgi:Kef-type K+ transport system membrane component KefB
VEPNLLSRVVADYPTTGHQLTEVILSSTVLIVILVLLLLGVLPTWGHSRNWGYAPSGLLGVVLIVLLVLALTGRL